MSIRIIITGGTFDKHYDEIRGSLTFKDSHLPGNPEVRALLGAHRAGTEPAHRQPGHAHVQPAARAGVLSAGTRRAGHHHARHRYDGRETAGVLGEAGLAKTIVLTGAMVPYIFNNSDAVFNLGCAITAVQVLPRGVYIAMNGRIFGWDRVQKNGSWVCLKKDDAFRHALPRPATAALAQSGQSWYSLQHGGIRCLTSLPPTWGSA